jgi:hypothetical protein
MISLYSVQRKMALYTPIYRKLGDLFNLSKIGTRIGTERPSTGQDRAGQDATATGLKAAENLTRRYGTGRAGTAPSAFRDRPVRPLRHLAASDPEAPLPRDPCLAPEPRPRLSNGAARRISKPGFGAAHDRSAHARGRDTTGTRAAVGLSK